MSKTRVFALVALAVLIGIGSYLVAKSDYLLFHSFADMITVFIAASVFVVAWNGRKRLDNDYFLFVGIAFLFFAFVDFMHLLGNKNMGVFTGYGNLGPPFYIASRYLLGISLLIAPLFMKRRLNVPVTLAVYAAVSAAVVLSILVWRNFPTTFIDGVGLTPFKVISDYVICGLLAAAIGVHFLNRKTLEPRVFKLLTLALVLAIATGLAFTLYTDPFGITNMVGHFFQIGTFGVVFAVFVEIALNRPQDILYRDLRLSDERVRNLNTQLNQEITQTRDAEQALRHSNERLQRVLDNETVGVMFWDLTTGRMTDANDTFLKLMGYSRSEVDAGELTWQKLTPPEYVETSLAEIEKFHASGRIGPYEKEYFQKDGARRWLLFAGSSLVADQCVEFCVDISERKQAEKELRESEQRQVGVLESMPDAFVAFDRNLRYTYLNSNAARIQNVKPEDLLGKDVRQVYPDAESYKTISLYERVIAEQKPVTAVTHHSGFGLWTEVRAFPTPDGVSVFFKDVTEQVKARQTLVNLNEELEKRVQIRTEELTRSQESLLKELRLRSQAEASLRSLSAQLLTVQEEERGTIAMELHDQIGQSLTVLKLMLARITRDAPESLKPQLFNVSDSVSETMQAVRSLSLSLRPGVLDTLGLVPALEWLFDDLNKRAGLDIHFVHDAALDIPHNVGTTVYRITQEAMTNIMRHSGVKEAWVRLEIRDGKLDLTIEDHGRGFDIASLGRTTGISAMRERAALLGGVCLTESEIGRGTSVKVSLPLS